MLIITLVRADDAKQLISLNIFRNKLVLKLLLFGNGSLSSDGFLAKKKNSVALNVSVCGGVILFSVTRLTCMK